MADDKVVDAACILFWDSFMYGVNKKADPPKVDDDVLAHAKVRFTGSVQGILIEEHRIDLIKEALVCSFTAGRFAYTFAKQKSKSVDKEIFDEACAEVKRLQDRTPTGGRLCGN